ncbi:hypothetical protein [Bacteriophage Phobos]|uniref:Uncharacterized protein n=1 Tax=Bacteriophage Phobos TaxID=2662138 RepID=A0A5Q2U9B2_9CAUD|nr:hypothetical protein JT319_gp49 [Bacteriophage Phobos]QGH45018.1 hypothetical protein [Bacteriophage Phobos]WPK42415.1 hypothetical protein [Pseudomonas phage Ppu-503]
MSKLRYIVLTENAQAGVILDEHDDAVYASTGRMPETACGIDVMADAFNEQFEDDRPEGGFECIVINLDTLRLACPKNVDELGVQNFANRLNQRLDEKRAQGYGGWQDELLCPVERLEGLYRRAVMEGDLVNVGNYAMMLTERGVHTCPVTDEEKTHWNPASKLPPVNTPLTVRLPASLGIKLGLPDLCLCIRPEWVDPAGKDGELRFQAFSGKDAQGQPVFNGAKFSGRFEWTYP